MSEQLLNITVNQILLLNPAINVSDIDSFMRRMVWHTLNVSPDGSIAWGICMAYPNRRTPNNPPINVEVNIDTQNLYLSRCNAEKNCQDALCEHVITLLCMMVKFPQLFKRADPNDYQFVKRWRKQIVVKEDENRRDQQLIDPIAIEKINQTRHLNTRSGFESLQLWLHNVLKYGLDDEQVKDVSVWEKQAARMIDVDTSIVAARLHQAIPIIENIKSPERTGRNDARVAQENLLIKMSHLYLLLHSFMRFEQLTVEQQADVRTAVGWHYRYNEVAHIQPIEDDWVVLGCCEEMILEGILHQKRTWLRGITTGKDAVLIECNDGSEPFSSLLKRGDIGQGALIYRPSNYPLEAFVHTWRDFGSDVSVNVVNGGIRTQIDAYERAITANPWLTSFPFLLENAVLTGHNRKWFIHDDNHDMLPVAITHCVDHWRLISQVGERPIRVAAEWDGNRLHLIGIIFEETVINFDVNIRWFDYKQAIQLPETWRNVAIVGTSHMHDGALMSDPTLSDLSRRLAKPSPEHLLYLAITNLTFHHRLSHIAHLVETYQTSQDRLQFFVFDEPSVLWSDALQSYFELLCVWMKERNSYGNYGKLFAEFIQIAADNQLRIPHKYVPDLLEFGKQQIDSRAQIASLVGKHGLWVGRNYRKTTWILTYADDADYRFPLEPQHDSIDRFRGERIKRSRAAHTILSQKGIRSLTTKWMDTLSIGLSMEDEPFLEKILQEQRIDRGRSGQGGYRSSSRHRGYNRRERSRDSRYRYVRRLRATAVNLLAQLPQSRFCQRMIERVQPWLRILHDLDPQMANDLYPTYPHFRLVIEHDVEAQFQNKHLDRESMQRDGIGFEKNARYFEQILSYVPPSHWYEQWGATAREVVRAFESAAEPADCNLLLALSKSAIYAHDDTLLLEIAKRHEFHHIAKEFSSELVEVMSNESLVAVAQTCLHNSPLSRTHAAYPFLDELTYRKNYTWSTDLMEAYLKALTIYITQDHGKRNSAQSICKDISMYLLDYPSDMKSELISVIGKGFKNDTDANKKTWGDTIDQVIFWFDFRSEMRSEILAGADKYPTSAPNMLE